MLLYINDTKTVGDLQDRFNKCFPHLKLEFYEEPGHLKHCSKANLVRSKTLIGAIRDKSNSGILDIKSWDKTSNVKQRLKEIFGLNVQLFRKHGDEWIPASYSDSLSLRQQSDLARDYARHQLQ